MTDSEATSSKAADNVSADSITAPHSAESRKRWHGIESPGSAARTAAASRVPGRMEGGTHAAQSRLELRTATGLEKVTAAVIATAGVQPGDRVIDLGCGAGQVSIALAEQGARVLAVDSSQPVISRLRAVAQQRSLPGLEALTRPVHSLSLPIGSADLIVTSYALHRLRDADKQRLVAAAYHWLRPGGMLIVADMMFGRGTSSQDRAIIKSKVRSLAKKGIGGWWRIAKNGYRYLVRVREHPVSISAWTALFARAGFTGITASRIVNEAGLVSGRRPVTDPADDRDRPGAPGPGQRDLPGTGATQM